MKEARNMKGSLTSHLKVKDLMLSSILGAKKDIDLLFVLGILFSCLQEK